VKRLLAPLLCALAAVSPPAPARAWDPYGHMLVDRLAYDRLDPKAKAAVDALAARVPYPGETYTPVTMGCWMDDLRTENPDNPFSGKFKPWHFIVWGLEPGDASPPLEPGDDNDTRKGNVVQGLKRSYAVLQGGQDPYIPDKAVALAIFSHLMGDLHQPLHCASRFFENKDGKKTNDSGGNRVQIDNSPELALPLGNKARSNLHSFWDESYRGVFNPETRQLVVDEALKDYTKKDLEALEKMVPAFEPYLREKPAVEKADFETWARESNALARDFAYPKLPRFKLNRYADVDAAYVDGARDIARKRIALAAQRLAALLNQVLGEGK
jgi:hypothetical protein